MLKKMKIDPSLYAWVEENNEAGVMAHLKDGWPLRSAAKLYYVKKSKLCPYFKLFAA